MEKFSLIKTFSNSSGVISLLYSCVFFGTHLKMFSANLIARIFETIFLFIVDRIISPPFFKNFLILNNVVFQLSICSKTSNKIIKSYFCFRDKSSIS